MISAEICIRITSLLIFPCIYLTLSIVSIFHSIKIGFLFHERLGHLALNTDLYLRRKYLGLFPQNETHIFLIYSPANKQLVRMFSRRIILINSMIISKIMTPIGLFQTRYWIPLPFVGNEYNEFNSAPQQIFFTKEEQIKGNSYLRKIGLKEGCWYVCIFARDHQYYQVYSKDTDLSFSDHRNADIDTYELGIKAVIDAGGWVIRMGSCVEKPLKIKHPQIIDYGFNYREDFADIYITANARFFVGTTSGASDICVLFDIPFVGVNWVPIGYAPFGKNSIFIPKRIIWIKNGRQVSLQEQMGAFTGNQISTAIIPEQELLRRGWMFCDNTPEEIADVVNEMLDRMTGKFISDDEYKIALKKYTESIPKENIYLQNKSPMGRKMILSMNFSNK
jgi:putative glycosyltransferase (TIGR04372 family)